MVSERNDVNQSSVMGWRRGMGSRGNYQDFVTRFTWIGANTVMKKKEEAKASWRFLA